MVYLEYEVYRTQYFETQRMYHAVLCEKEALFQKTQPQAITYDKEKVSGGVGSNPLEEYVERKEERKIDERLSEVKSLLEDREHLLKIKLEELRASNNVEDKIYLLRFIDRVRVFKIAKMIGYSESQVYRIIEKIIAKCEKMRENARNSMLN